MYRVWRTRCTEYGGPGVQSMEDKVYRVWRTRYTEYGGPGIQSMEDQVYRVWRTRCTEYGGPGIQSMEDQVYRVWRTRCTEYGGPGIQSMEDKVYRVWRTRYTEYGGPGAVLVGTSRLYPYNAPPQTSLFKRPVLQDIGRYHTETTDVAVLTEVLPSVVTEAEVPRIIGIQGHTTTSTSVSLGYDGLLKVSVKVWVMWCG